MKKPEEILEDVLTTFGVLIDMHMEGIEPFKISWKSESKEFFNNDQALFSLIMSKYHFALDLEIEEDDYEINTEFEKFPTLNHAYSHVANKVLLREGFDPATLKPIR